MAFVAEVGHSGSRLARRSNGCDSSFRMSAAQPEERVAGLRIDAMADGLLIAAVGQIKLPEKPMELTLLIMGPTNRGFGFALEPNTSPLSLFHGAGPVASHLQYFRAMDKTLAAKGNEIRLRLAPHVEGAGPFLRPFEIKDALAS